MGVLYRVGFIPVDGVQLKELFPGDANAWKKAIEKNEEKLKPGASIPSFLFSFADMLN